MGAAGILGAPHARRLLALERGPDYYPPALTGMRGSHDGSFEVAHALHDGSFWPSAGAPTDTGEHYDLVVVGAGLSGLAAAIFFRESAGPHAKVLLLDNHDDLGGHCRRNEFSHGGRRLLSYGGGYAIESPAPYSGVAQGMIARLGIDVTRDALVLDRKLYGRMGLRRGVFFDRETFGSDKLLGDPLGDFGGEVGDESSEEREVWLQFLAEAPIPARARRDLLRLCRSEVSCMSGLTGPQVKARLARMSYADFLSKEARADPGLVPFLTSRTHGLYGLGIDAVSAQDAWGLGLPGFKGLPLDSTPGPGMGLDALPGSWADSYFFHFPDGNASIARLMVRRLIPAALPGRSTEDVVTARLRYARLDVPGSPVRLRLDSTAVRVRHVGDPASASEVEIAYCRSGKLSAVRASRCILACWHQMIPYLCAELPETQRAALTQAVKVPIVYTNVLTRNWKAWHSLGFSAIEAPGSYHTSASLGRPSSIGDYECPKRPQEPMVLHLVRTPCSPGLPAREQHQVGRMDLLSTPFEVFEEKVKDQLGRMLGKAEFDAARDVLAITVNRWPHGYAYQYNSLWDPFWLNGEQTPCERARSPFGRLAIANADAAAYSYADAAIDQAYRAVQEVLRVKG